MPPDNRLCESFNGRLKNECLNMHQFKSIEEAKRIIKISRCDYKEKKHHSSLGNLIQCKYPKQGQRYALNVDKF